MTKALFWVIALITLTFSSQTLVKSSTSLNSEIVPASPDKLIPQQYIVVYKDNLENAEIITEDFNKKLSSGINLRFDSTISGFSAKLSKEELDSLKKNPKVAFVTQDKEISISSPLLPLASSIVPSTPRIPPKAEEVEFNLINPLIQVTLTDPKTLAVNSTPNTLISTPTPAPTARAQPVITLTEQVIPNGVQRIGLTATNEGTGIGVAVLDTGIDQDHPDLSINIIAGKNCLNGSDNADDDNGHGTHVAGIIGALNNSEGVIGVAPQSKLVSVKVLDSKGKGTLSGLICGIDWVAKNAIKYNIKVANLSLGATGQSDNNCGKTNEDALHLAICKSRNEGLIYLTSAGNDNSDVLSTIPASYDDAVITVSALNDSDGIPNGYGYDTWSGADDTFAGFSNFGYAVDLGAPGVDILSTRNGGGYAKLSGTSMSAAHVSGAVALYLKINPDAVWNEVRDGLITVGEPLRSGHTDPSRLHPEKVVKTNSF